MFIFYINYLIDVINTKNIIIYVLKYKKNNYNIK